MTSCWLCAKVVNDISRNFFSLQSYVYSPQHNKGRNHHTYIYVKVVPAGKTDIFTCENTGIYFRRHWRHMKTSSLKHKDYTLFGFVYASILIKFN
jgi:hypothetical protein